MGVALKRHVKEMIETLAKRAIEVVRIDMTGSGHYKLRIQRNGTQAVLVIPASPGDWRGNKNALSSASIALRTKEIARVR